MDNFKTILVLLVLICTVGILDTTCLGQKVTEYKILKLYKNKTRIIGFGLEQNGNYLKVKDVIDNTPAQRAGVMDRDIIVSLNYIKVSNLRRFMEVFTNLDSNDKLILGVLRPGQNHILYIGLKPQFIPKVVY